VTAADNQLRHCDKSYLSAVKFLVDKHPGALNCSNRMGWLPFHVAALQDVALDVLFYLICQDPGALQCVDPCYL